jgi:hypothetical protein
MSDESASVACVTYLDFYVPTLTARLGFLGYLIESQLLKL